MEQTKSTTPHFDNLQEEYESYLTNRKDSDPYFTFSGWLQFYGHKCADDNMTEVLALNYDAEDEAAANRHAS